MRLLRGAVRVVGAAKVGGGEWPRLDLGKVAVGGESEDPAEG
jgi:hypothetical protein